MFKIGEFSQIVRVSPRMLRYYEQSGLLMPAKVDSVSGYRLYSAGQIPLLSKITLLRDMGFGVEEIRALLPLYENPEAMRTALEGKSREIRVAIAAEQDKLQKIAALRGKLEKESVSMVYEVEIKSLPAVKVLSLRGIIPQYRDEGMLWEKLGKYIGERQIAAGKDGYSTYFDGEYKESGPDVEIAVPVDTLGESRGEFVYKEYAEIPLAATVRFSGPFDGGYDAAGQKLADWMERSGYQFAGYLRGHVLTSPDEESNPEKWLTELQAPVKKV
ncbi:MAG TPA: MerR family transcriptional regulator [Ruminococcaceae bacterium]|nr:MerR family transcriptional regulator [Oscillospiraceae bacterium]